MNKTKKMSFGGAKKKLMGAVCMLLVASIMMISATYAWFTLSTAPEITGITTSVGANGNLEMALLSGNVNDRTTQEGGIRSSMAVVADTVANLTWGNLVDLSDDSAVRNHHVLDPHILQLFFDHLQCSEFFSGNLRVLVQISAHFHGIVKFSLGLF